MCRVRRPTTGPYRQGDRIDDSSPTTALRLREKPRPRGHDFARLFMRKVLTEGVPTATLRQPLSDKRYRISPSFQFAALGAQATRTNARPPTRRQICAPDRRVEPPENRAFALLSISSARPPGSQCLQILADPALSQVVRTALGLSDYSSAADIDCSCLSQEALDLNDWQVWR